VLFSVFFRVLLVEKEKMWATTGGRPRLLSIVLFSLLFGVTSNVFR
jgi:hypothetical protein